jgi:hypothetical protein
LGDGRIAGAMLPQGRVARNQIFSYQNIQVFERLIDVGAASSRGQNGQG